MSEIESELKRLTERLRKLSIKLCLLVLSEKPTTILEISTLSKFTVLEISRAMKVCYKNKWVEMKKIGRGYPYNITNEGRKQLELMKDV